MQQELSIIEVEYGTDLTFVTLTNERIVDEKQIRELQESLDPVIEKNYDGRLVLNFINVKFMTSALLALLMRIHRRVFESGGQLQLSNLSSNLRTIFEITQLTKVFDIS
jgi:anti-sigma B factor antagonist